MAGKVYDVLENMLARLEDNACPDELYIADSVLKRLTRGGVKVLSIAVNRVRESTTFELYRIDGPDRQGYLLQIPPTGRSTTKQVKSIEVEVKEKSKWQLSQRNGGSRLA